MDVMLDGAACAVCRLSMHASVDSFPLSEILGGSGYPVAQFLLMYEIVGREPDIRSICCDCYNLVARCDELHVTLFSTVEELRKKSRLICEETSLHSFVIVKHEEDPSLKAELKTSSGSETSNIVVLLQPSPEVQNDASIPARDAFHDWKDAEDTLESCSFDQTMLSDVLVSDEGRSIVPETVTNDCASPLEVQPVENSQILGSSEQKEDPAELLAPEVEHVDSITVDSPVKALRSKKTGVKSPTAASKFCPLCGEPAIPGKFTQHVRSVHPEVKRLKAVPADWLRCVMCPYKTRLKERLERHLLLKHKIGKLIPCPDCDKQLTTKERLLAHANLVHGKAKAFKCDKCDKAFSSYPGLYAHAKFHSTEVVTRVCDECGEEVDSRRYLHHVWSKHKPRKVEEAWCEHCGKFFKCKKGFVKHLANSHGIGEVRKASSEIAKTCQECGKQVKSDELFYAHLFVKHGIERPELKKRTCPHCEEVFYVKDKLRAHIQLHTGEKKYVCADCGYSTRFSGNLHKHRKGVHGKTKPADTATV